ncbi:uncharacterized protein PITG_21890 [Phytophthora infestans T30-4]|uniref:Uncharacterized protein n=1 Tax=Phytophthora infestans (strain T30-4) TaxID=403677 RepID=D0P4Q8_PHYIT|nr:uncharacterized protein PITG_21890 [Phytophthora infestans T30-4]EEY68861.1 conserved hypothetical protein [Phytophthora infestans T30-4]|eukprot:XP_002996893.1 conserved hypothetical protein [Phytophthora infestans T30-4]
MHFCKMKFPPNSSSFHLPEALISSPGGDDQDDDSKRDFVSVPGSSSVDDDGDDDFEPPRDSSNSSDTLQERLNEIALKADQKTREGRKRGSRRARKSDKRRRRESGMESYGTDDGSVADTDSLPPTDEEREDADVENVRLDLQDPNTDRTPRVRRTESYPERVALERSRSPRHSDREKTQLHE